MIDKRVKKNSFLQPGHEMAFDCGSLEIKFNNLLCMRMCNKYNEKGQRRYYYNNFFDNMPHHML